MRVHNGGDGPNAGLQLFVPGGVHVTDLRHPTEGGRPMRLIRCDGCGAIHENPGNSLLGPRFSWIDVEANEDADHGQFCSWSCLTSWATKRALEREPVLGEP